jgi:hypothetical protein
MVRFLPVRFHHHLQGVSVLTDLLITCSSAFTAWMVIILTLHSMHCNSFCVDTALDMWCLLLWDGVQCWFVTGYWLVGTACRSHLQETDAISKNIHNVLPTNAIQHPSTAKMFTTPEQKSEILHQIVTCKPPVLRMRCFKFCIQIVVVFPIVVNRWRDYDFLLSFLTKQCILFINMVQRRAKNEVLHQQGQIAI